MGLPRSLTRDEWLLVMSAIDHDKVGRWGDERHQALEALKVKVKQRIR